MAYFSSIPSFSALTMATTTSQAQPYDLEGATSYSAIPAGSPTEQPKPKKLFGSIVFASFLLLSLILLVINQQPAGPRAKLHGSSPFAPATPLVEPPSRGVAQGVSEKVFRQVSGGNLSFGWTNAMLSWQRTSFHFQPAKNWMNDPNDPRT